MRKHREVIGLAALFATVLAVPSIASAAKPDWGTAGEEKPAPSQSSTPKSPKPSWEGTTGPTPPAQTLPPAPGTSRPGTAGRPKAVLGAPPSVQYGSGFVLDGSSSSAAGGRKIVKYVWTWVRPGLRAVTTVPRMEVAFRDKNPIPAGANQFQLMVEDDMGNRSEPASAQVIVQKPPVARERSQPSERGSGRRPQPFKRMGEE